VRRLAFRDAAVADLGAILEYLARESGSEVVGRRFVDGLRAQCRKLASLPGTLGRPRPDLRPGLRRYVHRGYVILFRYEPDKLIVVRVLEGHRDVAAVLGDDP